MGPVMSPELAKTRAQRIAQLLDRIADLWLLVALFTALYFAVAAANAGGLGTLLLLIVMLAPALGLKLWARRVLRRTPPTQRPREP